MSRELLTIQQAAAELNLSPRHIERLIEEATRCRKSRWRFGRELVDLTPLHSKRRTVRVNINAVVPESAQHANPHLHP